MKRANIALSIGLLLALTAFVSCKNNTPPSKPGTKAEPKSTAKAGEYNHDMSAYKKLAEEAMKLAKDDKLPEAYPKTKELEKVFDDGTKDLHEADVKLWKSIDDQMDVAINATNPAKDGTSKKSVAELQKYIEYLGKVPPQSTARPSIGGCGMRQPLAIAVIGGQIVNAILTRLVPSRTRAASHAQFSPVSCLTRASKSPSRPPMTSQRSWRRSSMSPWRLTRRCCRPSRRSPPVRRDWDRCPWTYGAGVCRTFR